jgi:hypothetical protein
LEQVQEIQVKVQSNIVRFYIYSNKEQRQNGQDDRQ